MIDILFPAFLISLVLLGIHSYFGIRIIQRDIIFTDLAIGQTAALGAAVALYYFQGEHIYISSLTFAIIGGIIISAATKYVNHLEALIGLLYALGISGVFIILSKSAHGVEEFQNLMAYDILFTDINEVYKTAIIYGIIGIVIFIIEKKAKGFLKEILFFLTFAITITSSVKMAGVLVVFAILLAPAYISINLGLIKTAPQFIKKQPLILAWIIGTIINTIAIIISFYGDFPTGYTLVFTNAFIAIVISFFIGKNNISSVE